MSDPLKLGDVVHGFVEGHLGRDHYQCFRVVAIGLDWVVGRTVGYKPYPVAALGQAAIEACKRARFDKSYCWEACPDGE